MTSSTSYCLYDTPMDPWNVCIYKHIYVRMYVHTTEVTETELKNKFLEKYQENFFLSYKSYNAMVWPCKKNGIHKVKDTNNILKIKT